MATDRSDWADILPDKLVKVKGAVADFLLALCGKDNYDDPQVWGPTALDVATEKGEHPLQDYLEKRPLVKEIQDNVKKLKVKELTTADPIYAVLKPIHTAIGDALEKFTTANQNITGMVDQGAAAADIFKILLPSLAKLAGAISTDEVQKTMEGFEGPVAKVGALAKATEYIGVLLLQVTCAINLLSDNLLP